MENSFKWIRIIEFSLILFATMVVAVSVGSANLSVEDSLKIVVDRIPLVGNLVDISDIGATYEIIVWKVRMPRIIMSAMVGGALAVVGGAFQGVFRNSLADPHILGVSSGAALGATVGMLTGISVSFFGLGPIGVFAFVGAIVAVFFVYNVSKIGGEVSTTSMLLTGTAISTMLSSIISLLMTFDQERIDRVYMWTLGSFTAANWEKNAFLFIVVAVGVTIMISLSGKLNVLMMGEEEAKSMGVDTVKTRRLIIIVSSMLVASAVSVSGVIGFVGLIIPHSVRMISGPNNKRLMPYAFLWGAIFLLVCDTIARTIASPTEIPVGIITSIFGAPYFVTLIIRNKKRV